MARAGQPLELRQRLWTADQIHQEYGWDAIVREQWAPLLARLAGEIAPAASEQTPVTPSAARRTQAVQAGEGGAAGMIEECVIAASAIVYHPDLVNLYGCTIGPLSTIGPFVEISAGDGWQYTKNLQPHVHLRHVRIGNYVFVGTA